MEGKGNEGALNDLNEIIRLKPDSENEVYISRSKAESRLSKFRESAQDLTVVINRKPTLRNIDLTTDDLYYRSATCHFKCGEYRKAVADCDVLLKMDDNQE